MGSPNAETGGKLTVTLEKPALATELRAGAAQLFQVWNRATERLHHVRVTVTRDQTQAGQTLTRAYIRKRIKADCFAIDPIESHWAWPWSDK